MPSQWNTQGMYKYLLSPYLHFGIKNKFYGREVEYKNMHCKDCMEL